MLIINLLLIRLPIFYRYWSISIHIHRPSFLSDLVVFFFYSIPGVNCKIYLSNLSSFILCTCLYHLNCAIWMPPTNVTQANPSFLIFLQHVSILVVNEFSSRCFICHTSLPYDNALDYSVVYLMFVCIQDAFVLKDAIVWIFIHVLFGPL